MRSIIIGIIAGVVYLQNQGNLPSLNVLLCLLILLGVLGLLTWKILPDIPKIIALICCGMLVGVVWSAAFAHYRLSEELPQDLEGQNITIVGTIDSLPYKFENGVRFNFAREKVLSGDVDIANIPSKIALSWYAGFNGEELSSIGNVAPGERWQLTVRLQKPHGNANPNNFDYELWLFEQGIRATGYVRADQKLAFKNMRLTPFVWNASYMVEGTRAWLRDRIYQALPDQQYAGVLVALVIGDQRAIAQSDWKVFNRTGIGHLISISGLHITMVAGLFAACMFFLWRHSFFTDAQLPLILPAHKVAALTGVVIALLYVLLAGFGVPAQRTLYMLSVVALALWMGRIGSVSHVLCLALLMVMLLDPWAVLWPGFWLSFGAVAMILYASVGRVQTFVDVTTLSTKQKWWHALSTGAYTQYVVTLGLVPLTMLLFGQVSLVSPIANAVAIPLISFLVTPLALLGSVLPQAIAHWVLIFAHQLVVWMAGVLGYLSQFSMAVWAAPVAQWWMFLLAMLGTVWLLAPRGWPYRFFGLIGWLPLCFNTAITPTAGELWVTAFDIGQGMSVLVETPTHRLLYDTGAFFSKESNGADRVILPYLKARGITSLDTMVVSHADNDHAGGALPLLGELSIKSVVTSLPMDHRIVLASPSHTRCSQGQSWVWDGVQMDMLQPTLSSYDNDKLKTNARSCALKISMGDLSLLLPGDIEAPQERALLEALPERLASTILLAPHHGSGTSSTAEFLKAVHPKMAIFQVGYRNRYHHPKAEVFERYQEMGIERIRTDYSGAILFKLTDKVVMQEYRKIHARYWYGR